MPRFEEQILSSKRKREKIFGIILVVLGIGLIALNIFFNDAFWRHFFSIIFGLNFIGSGIQHIKGRKPLYLKIDDQKIESLFYEKSSSISLVTWDDIKWIKKENSGGLTFFRESSFSNHFDLQWMTDLEKSVLMSIVVEMANAKKVRLVNF